MMADDIEAIVLGDERSVPCEACDDGTVIHESVSPHEQPEDLVGVCRACGGWGWREP